MAILPLTKANSLDPKMLVEHARVAVSRGHGKGWGILGEEVLRADIFVSDVKTWGRADAILNAQNKLYTELAIGAAERCPECLNCPHLSVKLDSHPDYISGMTRYQGAVYCGTRLTTCPDGRSKFTRIKIEENPNLAPKFPTNFGAPYTKTASSDVPTTASGTDW
jgi:hypothetical protein